MHDEPRLRIDVFHQPDPRIDEVLVLLHRILEKEDAIMATLTDVQAAVTAEDTVVDSSIALIQGLASQVAALQPNQAAIDTLAADIRAKSTALANAVSQNTPAVPPTA